MVSFFRIKCLNIYLYCMARRFISGAPNENIIQNHLNIALLNVC